MASKIYPTIGLGGTFDHFHVGHEAFLNFAHSLADILLIGLTDDLMVADKSSAAAIQPFALRKQAVMQFCQQQQIKAKIVKLTDPYGPTLNQESVPALAVTTDTIQGAKKINDLRAKLKLRPLIIHECALVQDETGEIISSSRIRAGLINRSGRRYDQILKHDLNINESQKQFLSQIQGELVESPNQASSFNAVVGDHSVKYFLDHHWPLQLAVYDLKEKRVANPAVAKLIKQPDIIVSNPQGVISAQLSQGLQQAINQQLQLVQVEGEDDLAAVALMILLPLQAHIYYGQPDKGMVEMVVTEHKKEQFYELLKPNLSQNQ